MRINIERQSWIWTVRTCCQGTRRGVMWETRTWLGWMLTSCLGRKIILWRKRKEGRQWWRIQLKVLKKRLWRMVMILNSLD